MCYDRYVAICKPLHYGTLLGSRACAHMAAAAWASACLNALVHTANTFSLPLCHGNALGQFFCEIPQILKLSCSHSDLRELGLIVVSTFLLLGCFIFIVFSYVQIFRAVLRIPSEQGQRKAFSTCLPHLAVVSLFLTTVIFAYLKPPSISSPSLDLVVSVLYSVVPPTLNPLIYSLRNQELKDACRQSCAGRAGTGKGPRPGPGGSAAAPVPRAFSPPQPPLRRRRRAGPGAGSAPRALLLLSRAEGAASGAGIGAPMSRENPRRGWRVGMRSRRDPSPITITGKTDSEWAFLPPPPSAVQGAGNGGPSQLLLEPLLRERSWSPCPAPRGVRATGDSPARASPACFQPRG
ncbi:olfactory receptor 14J1-like [Pithys albifrons albifrons]|uniref:olfactory receptor 14J1-like n=1 Tax=Pithys albifrons albifrons TaxID=3385563 RepID=UPI003A5D112F